MSASAFFTAVATVFNAIGPLLMTRIVDYVRKAMSGEDITDHDVHKMIPDELQTEVQDAIKTAQREAAGMRT